MSRLRLRRLKQQDLPAASPQRFNLIASDAEIIRPADGLESAGRDQIENPAGIDAEDARGIRPADEGRGGWHDAERMAQQIQED